MKIMVTYAGAAGALGVIKMVNSSRYKDDVEIIAIDSNEHAVGLSWVDKSYVISNYPSGESDLKKIIDDEKPDLILPMGDEDLSFLSQFENSYMSDTEIIDLCNDKWFFHEHYSNFYEKELPKTSLDAWVFDDYPIIQKPRVGRGSRGVRLIENSNDMASVLDTPMVIYQEYLPGQEWTIDCLITDEEKIIIPRKRLSVKAGNSTCGKIELNTEIISFLKRFFEGTKYFGVLCVQMKEDKFGKLKLTEINPRFGGGSIFSSLAGVNFMEIILAKKYGHDYLINTPKDITVSRYWEEVVS